MLGVTSPEAETARGRDNPQFSQLPKKMICHERLHVQGPIPGDTACITN